MPKASDFFKSRTVNCQAIGDKTITTTITKVEPEKMQDDEMKLGLYTSHFADKFIALNTGNLNRLIQAFGDDYSKWAKRKVKIQVLHTDKPAPFDKELKVTPLLK